MKRYETFPIGDLVTEVPVDPLHTKELADSIKSRGQLNPVIVREETREVIDGFHRVAAMAELGFDRVECVITPCDDEEFWDFRIIQASLHKSVTFARAIEWIDRVFQLSPWTEEYKTAASLFRQVAIGSAPKKPSEWVETKAKVWGLAPRTIENWLRTKESLEPSLLEDIKRGTTIPTDTYIEVAKNLPTQRELHRPIVEKATREDLSSREVREVTQALRRAEDEEEVQSILKQPVSRTEDQMVRDAKVEKLLTHPREVTPAEEHAEAREKDTLYKIDLMGIIYSSNALTQEKIDALTPAQKEDLYATCEQAIAGIRRVMDILKPGITTEYQLRKG